MKFVVFLKICYNNITIDFLNRISNSYVIFLQIEFGCVFLYALLQIEGIGEKGSCNGTCSLSIESHL